MRGSGPLVLTETFDAASADWQTWSGTYTRAAFENGVLPMAVISPSLTYNAQYLPRTFTDVAGKVDATVASAPTEGGVRGMFVPLEKGDYLRFTINILGSWDIYDYMDQKWVKLAAGSSDAIVAQVNATNRPRGESLPGLLSCYVNGVLLASMPDSTPRSGGIGLVTASKPGGNVLVHFDNLAAYGPTGEALSPTDGGQTFPPEVAAYEQVPPDLPTLQALVQQHAAFGDTPRLAQSQGFSGAIGQSLVVHMADGSAWTSFSVSHTSDFDDAVLVMRGVAPDGTKAKSFLGTVEELGEEFKVIYDDQDGRQEVATDRVWATYWGEARLDGGQLAVEEGALPKSGSQECTAPHSVQPQARLVSVSYHASTPGFAPATARTRIRPSVTDRRRQSLLCGEKECAHGRPTAQAAGHPPD